MTRTLTLALITVIATLLYLGLAVLGWGGLAAFFSHPALVALTIMVFVMSSVALFSSGNLSSGEREDRSNRWVIVVFSVIGLLMAYLPAYADRKDFWTLDGDAIRWFGVVLFTIGGALRIYPVFVLGRRFSGLVAIQPGHALVTSGVYGVIRHPSYLGLLIKSLGWCDAQIPDHVTAGTSEYSWCSPPNTDFASTRKPSAIRCRLLSREYSSSFRRIRHTWSQRHVRTRLVVMACPAFQDPSQVGL